MYLASISLSITAGIAAVFVQHIILEGEEKVVETAGLKEGGREGGREG